MPIAWSGASVDETLVGGTGLDVLVSEARDWATQRRSATQPIPQRHNRSFTYDCKAKLVSASRPSGCCSPTALSQPSSRPAWSNAPGKVLAKVQDLAGGVAQACCACSRCSVVPLELPLALDDSGIARVRVTCRGAFTTSTGSVTLTTFTARASRRPRRLAQADVTCRPPQPAPVVEIELSAADRRLIAGGLRLRVRAVAVVRTADGGARRRAATSPSCATAPEPVRPRGRPSCQPLPAAASWPQAAAMSRPRVSRTVARSPCSSSTARKALIASGLEPS